MKTQVLFLAAATAAVLVTAVGAEPGRRNSKSPKQRKGFHVDFNKEANMTQEARDAKFFPIFSIVQFRNEPCTANAGITGSGNQRNGTCFTSTECQDRGGTSSGNCAAGFGVCCVFIINDGESISENCTYIQNPAFPNSDTSTASASYTVNKCDDDVCMLRLDFETFTLQGVGSTSEMAEGICLDTFQVTVSTGQNIPTICGINTGQHIYVDIGANSGDSATLQFSFDGTNTARMWDIKVTQIECTNQNAPPNTCLQWHTGVSGRIETFNYAALNDNHLNDQDYTVCIRAEKGYCCVEYMVCPDQAVADSMSLDATQTPAVDDDCLSQDHILIPESAAECQRSGNANARAINSRYCGSRLRIDAAVAAEHMTICDCTAPFTVGIFTDGISDDATAAIDVITANILHSRGVCLEYHMVAC